MPTIEQCSKMEAIDKQTIDKLRGYETSYQEGAWEDFEQFRKKKKKRPLIIFWRMAAGVVISLIIGWGVYKTNKSDNQQVSVKQIQKTNKNSEDLKPEIERNSLTNEINISKRAANSQKVITQKLIKAPGEGEKTTIKQKDNRLNQIALIEEKDFAPDLLKAHTSHVVLVRPKTPFLPPYLSRENENINEKKANPVTLSIAIAGLSNQAANVLAQQNFGLRGTTEIALSRKAELSTGIYVSRENLNLQNTTIPLSTPVGIPQLNQVNYRWLNVEVPLNMRYRIWQKGAFAISTQAGVSVMGAFNQTSQQFYENRRTVVLVTVSENGQVQEVSTTFVDKEVRNNISNAQRLSLGTALNFSLGVHYPLGKNQLSVEPFFKYPVGAFTAEKLHYSSIGVQLRWSISTGRKEE